MTTPATAAASNASLITSASAGDPRTHHRLETLEARLQTLATPRDTGRVTMIVRRGDRGQRECLDRVALTTESGIPGDSWGRRSGASLDSQLTVIQSDVAELIANGQPLPLFGDNLYFDLDLSSGNLPTGSRVRAGSVVLEVSALPHNGCQKFNARFGNDALKFVSKKDLRHRNLRGIYMRVVEGGELAVGDRVEVISRS
jgi:MOSC domain-containing protein YiiM